ISNSFERRGRPSSHNSASRFRTTRYTSDQSKQPSLDHDRAANLPTPTSQRAVDELANPQGERARPRLDPRSPPKNKERRQRRTAPGQAHLDSVGSQTRSPLRFAGSGAGSN